MIPRPEDALSICGSEARADHAGAAAERVFPRAAPLPAHARDLLRVQELAGVSCGSRSHDAFLPSGSTPLHFI